MFIQKQTEVLTVEHTVPHIKECENTASTVTYFDWLDCGSSDLTDFYRKEVWTCGFTVTTYFILCNAVENILLLFSSTVILIY